MTDTEMTKILVVDDNEEFLGLLKITLESAGFDVVTAGDGEQAQNVFREFMPGIVVTDIVMPEIDGIELLLSLRKINPEMKIVAMSGGNSGYGDSYLNMAGKLGANAVLNKPFKMRELVSIVNDLA